MNRSLTALTLASALALSLSACGGDSAESAETAGTASASASASAGAGRGGGNNAQFQQIQECLTAAGIELPDMGARPTDRPSGMPTDRPTDMPSGAPSGRPTDMPSGGPGGAGGGGGMSKILQDEDAQAALKACGLEVPAGRPTASATASS